MLRYHRKNLPVSWMFVARKLNRKHISMEFPLCILGIKLQILDDNS